MRNHKSLFANTALVATLSFGLSACQPKADNRPPTLEVEWTAKGFENPESVMLSGDKSFLYVSNMKGEGTDRDGNGYISRLGKDGTVIEKNWASGMDAPKGMALNNNKLYVSDIDNLKEIDAVSGRVTNSISVPGAKFLNDVAYVPGLGVLISGSATKSLYLYDGENLSTWLEDDQLKGINGLHVDGDRVLIVTMTAGELLSLNPKDKSLTTIASGMEDADGIKVLKDGSYITSSWPGQLYHVSEAGVTTLLQDTKDEGIPMNDFELVGNTVYIANYKPGTVQAIGLK